MADLASLRERAPDLADSVLAAALVELAHGLDSPANSLTSKAMAMGQIRDTVVLIRELAPPPKQESPIDELIERRRRRLGGDVRVGS